MRKLLRFCLSSLSLAVASPSLAVAGDRCKHVDCGNVCSIYVIDSHRHVPEIRYKEIEIKLPKKLCKTILVEEKSEVVKPSYQTFIEHCATTIKAPHCKLVTSYVSCQECRPETTYKPVTVDVGHTECICQPVGHCGKVVATEVWVPKYIETYLPCTEIVCRDVLVPKTKVECQEFSYEHRFPIENSVVRYTKEELIRHVPLTIENHVEEVIKIRVPFATNRCVSCKEIFKSGDCSPQPIKTGDDICKKL